MGKTFTICAVGCALLLAAALTTSAPEVHRNTSSTAAAEIRFVDVAPQAGLTVRIVNGGEKTKKYIWESTGSGIAAIDYDRDGYPDLFILNGSTLEGFPHGTEPINHLYHNNQYGNFT